MMSFWWYIGTANFNVFLILHIIYSNLQFAPILAYGGENELYIFIKSTTWKITPQLRFLFVHVSLVGMTWVYKGYFQ